MTAMIMPSSSMMLRDAARSGFWKNSLAASLAVGLHAIVLALLLHGWSLEKPPVEQPAVLRTQLVMLPPAPQPQAPEPVAAPTPEPVAEAPIQPVKPAIDPQIQAQKLEQAVLARKRVEDKNANSRPSNNASVRRQKNALMTSSNNARPKSRHNAPNNRAWPPSVRASRPPKWLPTAANTCP